MKRGSIEIEEARIAFVESEGCGPAALLVHGNSSSSRIFQKQVEGPLGAEFRLAAIDLPGHGSSGKPRDPSATYSMPGLASVLVAASRALALEDAVFVGWSLGGHVVLEAADLLPNAAGFCVLGTPPLRHPPNFGDAFLPHPAGSLFFQEDHTEEQRREWVDSFSPHPMVDGQSLLEDIRRSDNRLRPTLLSSLGTIGYADEVEIVARMKQPLAVLHGRHDALINREYIASLSIPSLWRDKIQQIDAGHAPQWERPEEFDALIREFLLEVG